MKSKDKSKISLLFLCHPDKRCIFAENITTAYQKTGLKIAILIDEYDSPLQHSWKTPEHENYYDGYHFSYRNMVDIYNPYSLINALDIQDIGNFPTTAG